MSSESSSSGQTNNNVVSYDYGDIKKSNFGMIPKFNGDPEDFSWWKTNFYNYSWVKMKNYGTYLKMVLVTWSLMKKELLLIERNILLL
jgi:hypothetical protein